MAIKDVSSEEGDGNDDGDEDKVVLVYISKASV